VDNAEFRQPEAQSEQRDVSVLPRLMGCIVVMLVLLAGAGGLVYVLLSKTSSALESMQSSSESTSQKPDSSQSPTDARPGPAAQGLSLEAALERVAKARSLSCKYSYTMPNRDLIRLRFAGDYVKLAGVGTRQVFNELGVFGRIEAKDHPVWGLAVRNRRHFWVVTRWASGKTDAVRYPSGKGIEWDHCFPYFDPSYHASRFLSEADQFKEASATCFQASNGLEVRLDPATGNLHKLSWPTTTPSGKGRTELALTELDFAPDTKGVSFDYRPSRKDKVRMVK